MRTYRHLKLQPYLLAVCVGAVALLAAALMIKPTFDDFTTLSSPNYDPDFLRYLFPFSSTWRPLDAIMGYINAIDYRLFPALNHIEIWTAHLVSTLLVYVICRQLNIGILARSIATAFFFFSPCTLATTLSCDGTNQSTCHLMGMLSVWAYLHYKDRRRYILWMLFVILSSFCKDNGIAWAIVPPFIAWGTGRINRHTFIRHFAYGITLAVVYGIVRLSLPNYYPLNQEYEEQFSSLSKHIISIGKWLGYTWTATDFLSIFAQAHRNLAWATLTMLMSVPFFLLLFINRSVWRQRTTYALIAAIIITESPNLIIAMSLMNAYGSLGMSAILVGWLAQNYISRHNGSRWINRTFIVYLTIAVLVDIHHWYWAWKTSLPGMEMANEIVRQTKGKPLKAYYITIPDSLPKYSSFCVRTDDAFGWGISVWQVTGYTWPKTIEGCSLQRTPDVMQRARKVAHRAIANGYDCAWIINEGKVEVIQK